MSDLRHPYILDPAATLARLRQRRAEIDRAIQEIEAHIARREVRVRALVEEVSRHALAVALGREVPIEATPPTGTETDNDR